MMGWLGHGHGMWSAGHGTWGMGWIGSIVMISFWVLIFLGIIHLFRSTARSHEPSSRSQGRDPREILKERYAKGEIENREYREKMEVLG